MVERPLITVCGAGNAGVSIAADCSLKGFDVTLFELEKQASTKEPILEAGVLKFLDASVCYRARQDMHSNASLPESKRRLPEPMSSSW